MITPRHAGTHTRIVQVSKPPWPDTPTPTMQAQARACELGRRDATSHAQTLGQFVQTVGLENPDETFSQTNMTGREAYTMYLAARSDERIGRWTEPDRAPDMQKPGGSDAVV